MDIDAMRLAQRIAFVVEDLLRPAIERLFCDGIDRDRIVLAVSNDADVGMHTLCVDGAPAYRVTCLLPSSRHPEIHVSGGWVGDFRHLEHSVVIEVS